MSWLVKSSSKKKIPIPQFDFGFELSLRITPLLLLFNRISYKNIPVVHWLNEENWELIKFTPIEHSYNAKWSCLNSMRLWKNDCYCDQMDGEYSRKCFTSANYLVELNLNLDSTYFCLKLWLGKLHSIWANYWWLCFWINI